MSVKYLCDVCKEEITAEDLASLTYLDVVMTLTGKKEYVKKEHIFCKDCKQAMKDYMEELGKKAMFKDSQMEITPVPKKK